MRVERLHSFTGRFAAIQSRTSARKARSAGSSSTSSVVLSQLTQLRPQDSEPIAEHDVVAPDHAALERDALALRPHLGADGVAGKDRLGEARLDAGEPLGPIVRDGAQDRVGGDAE